MTDLCVDDLTTSFHRLTAALTSGEGMDDRAEEWNRLQTSLRTSIEAGTASQSVVGAAAAIAHNATVVITDLQHLRQRWDEELLALASELHNLTSGSSPLTDYFGRFSLSGQRETTGHSARLVSSDKPRAGEVHWRRSSETRQEPRLRHWFLTHLPWPYPTYTEKRNLALQAGISMSKIDSDLTNWRRRSGWGDICHTYARKSKDRMRMLMLRVQRGEETRPDLLDKVEGIRRYMDKECDKVGDWVHELASFARPEKRPKLDHACPTDTTPHHGGHRSFSSVSSSSSLSDISAFAATECNPSETHTRDSPPTRSVSGSSTLPDASMVVPSQGAKRSMSFTDDVEQVTNKAKISHSPLRAEPTWVDSPTQYASSDTSGFSGTYVSLEASSNSLSSFTASSESSLPSSESDDGQHTGESEMVIGSATAVSKVLTAADSIMSSECSSIWSTELELPSLPHMHNGSMSSWRIPTLSEFRPEIGRWVERG